jgi:hypothetical protein
MERFVQCADELVVEADDNKLSVTERVARLKQAVCVLMAGTFVYPDSRVYYRPRMNDIVNKAERLKDTYLFLRIIAENDFKST